MFALAARPHLAALLRTLTGLALGVLASRGLGGRLIISRHCLQVVGVPFPVLGLPHSLVGHERGHRLRCVQWRWTKGFTLACASEAKNAALKLPAGAKEGADK